MYAAEWRFGGKRDAVAQKNMAAPRRHVAPPDFQTAMPDWNIASAEPGWLIVNGGGVSAFYRETGAELFRADLSAASRTS